MLIRELALAARTLRKSPVFALTAILTIALGVGASTAIFSVANAVLLRPLPYDHPDRLVIAMSDMRNRNVRDFPFSNANFIDLRNGSTSAFQDLAGVFTFPFNLPGGDGAPEQVRVAVVTTNFFQLVGARMALGRDFTADDGIPQPTPPAGGAQQGAAPQRLPDVAILSYEYFQRRYGLNPAILGHAISTTADLAPQIVGVLPPRFQLYFPPSSNVEPAAEIWVANRLAYDNANRNGVSLHVVGRLKDGVSLAAAQAAADNVAAEARKDFEIQRTAGYAIRVEPMQQHLVSEVRPAILALMGAVIFLLLIACANVANLLLVRASLRERTRRARSNRSNVVGSRAPDLGGIISHRGVGCSRRPQTRMDGNSRIAGDRAREPAAARYDSNRFCGADVHGDRRPADGGDFRHRVSMARVAARRDECASRGQPQ